MSKIFLNLGSGPRAAMPIESELFQGWREVRVDVNEEAKPDLVASLVDLKGFIHDKSVDIVYCSHVIEHFYSHEVPVVLSEISRILKDDGIAVFKCPDLSQVKNLLDPDNLEKTLYESPAGSISVLDVLYGHRHSISNGNPFMAHKSGFTEEYLAKLLLDAGFLKISTQKGKSIDFSAKASFQESAYESHYLKLI